MNTNRLGLTLVSFAMLVVGGCATGVHDARPGPAPAPHTDVSVSGRVVVGDEHAQMVIVFSEDDRRHIHDYYYREQERYRDKREKHEKRKARPPGLAKRDALPPGLQKQIRRNGQLPPGIEGRRLPDELERHLSPLPANYIRLQVGRDIVLLNQRTRVTVDVIKNIFPE
jgi:hypothetical protein